MKKRSSNDKVTDRSKAKTSTKSSKERQMNQIKYIGMDVHMAMTVIVIMNSAGKVVANSTIETKAETIVDFFRGQRGTLYVTLEEGTQAAWLYDLIHPNVAKVVVCNTREIPKQIRQDRRETPGQFAAHECHKAGLSRGT